MSKYKIKKEYLLYLAIWTFTAICLVMALNDYLGGM